MTPGSGDTKSAAAQSYRELETAFAAHEAGNLDAADAAYRTILLADPRNFHALQLLGTLDAQRLRYASAERHWREALGVRPDSALVAGNLALILHRQGRDDEALPLAEAALAADAANVHALHHRASILRSLRRLDEAATTAERLLALAPEYPYALGLLAQIKRESCDWRSLDALTDSIVAAIRGGRPAVTPFTFLALSDSLPDQRLCAETFARAAAVGSTTRRESKRRDRIHVAYLSADFYDHPTAYLAAGLFESHDRARFEVTAVSYGGKREGAWRRRLEGAFERFVDLSDLSDAEAARAVASLDVDIAVDLKGYTKDARPGILEHRPASLQVAYLGYPGTSGSPAIDYLIADRTVVPSEHRKYYSEAVIALPETYQVNDRLPAAPPGPTRHAIGLPENTFIFACFASAYKITPPVFTAWMRTLKAAEGSVLWLLATSPAAVTNLTREAAAHRVGADRLLFAPPASHRAHLARQGCADLFLDTQPYGMHTGASDALAAGVPVLTCLGRSFAGRVAASLLRAVGLPELVAASIHEYEAIAIELARTPSRLATLSRRLFEHRAAGGIFDPVHFAKQLESAYTTIWERYLRGEPPSDLSVVAAP
ncbi:MAG: hypothetical protein U1E56_05650 [Bauldia sp.]